ncbi:hypothetical protein GCM10011529_30520 [Polymorphobacter glacialis]|uniref:DUF5681 domain-containing protein n=1 Tax=Sandarakinorhabdus glacialis TaxID=1614636 RepID=A0A917A0Z9_9SPHN|nr:DUF5681 domain-containing protein [Polymorphobacter glacialis]GGE21767.1 hypothetical protein GCM10011529_30520 [Polymorphobacter glacialis]
MTAAPQIRQRTRSGFAAVPTAVPAAGTTARTVAPPAVVRPETAPPAAAPIATTATTAAAAAAAAVTAVTGAERSYAVGFGKPPTGRPFAPGRSGNPKGRPKGAKNFHTLLDEALNQKIVMRERGRETMVSKREIAALRLANKAAEGDLKVLAMLLRHAGPVTPAADRGAPLDTAAGSDDAPLKGGEVLDELFAMACRAVADPAEPV